ncbi:hypothetical protein M569_06382 [Genlisea aurea]|uniref:BHLH domain-containing protein n=1 Tax=Genlisea aurea TaxID=192259 RepID=S8DYN8_9LAMI|nr:hypothetical protein M569_06382 [Genlisea aurea]
MGQYDGDNEFPATSAIDLLLNLHQIQSLHQDMQQSQMLSSSEFDPAAAAAASQDDFIEQMLSSDPAAFPWADGQQAAGILEEPPPPQANSLTMLQHQFCNEWIDGNDAGEGASFASANLTDDGSMAVKALFDGFHGSIAENSLPSQHYHHAQVLQTQNHGGAQPLAAAPSPTTAPPRQRVRVRARRGQATDPHSIAERLRRERIAERMKALQKLVPNANKTDKASMLDEIIEYVKFLQLQAKVLSVTRLGGGAAHESLEGGVVTTASSSSSNDGGGLAAMEQQVAKLMDEDIGAAMQYLQGKGLCLVPVSLAAAVSHQKAEDAGPSSPTASAMTLQSAKDAAGNSDK